MSYSATAPQLKDEAGLGQGPCPAATEMHARQVCLKIHSKSVERVLKYALRAFHCSYMQAPELYS